MAMVAAVLAGGASRRMGEPKAGLVIEGRTLLEWAVTVARDAGLRPVVVAKATSLLPAVAAERWTEPEHPRHPLAGIVAALGRAGPAGIVALACDTPLLDARLLRELARCHETTLVRAGGRLHPLPGRYAAAARVPLAGSLSAEAPLREALLALGAGVLDEPDESALFNVNTPDELAWARSALARARGERDRAPNRHG